MVRDRKRNNYKREEQRLERAFPEGGGAVMAIVRKRSGKKMSQNY